MRESLKVCIIHSDKYTLQLFSAFQYCAMHTLPILSLDCTLYNNIRTTTLLSFLVYDISTPYRQWILTKAQTNNVYNNIHFIWNYHCCMAVKMYTFKSSHIVVL